MGFAVWREAPFCPRGRPRRCLAPKPGALPTALHPDILFDFLLLSATLPIATPFPSLPHLIGALGKIPNCASARRLYVFFNARYIISNFTLFVKGILQMIKWSNSIDASCIKKTYGSAYYDFTKAAYIYYHRPLMAPATGIEPITTP